MRDIETTFDEFVALDIETTGLQQDAEIIEIGLVKIVQGKVALRWSTFVKPSKAIPKDISALTGITPNMVQDAPSWTEVEKEFLSHIDGQLLLAHNHKFDKSHIEFHLGRTLPNEWLDTHELSKVLLPKLTSYKLIALANYLQIKDLDHHRALNDAEVCARVYWKLMQYAKKLDRALLKELAEIFASPQLSLEMFTERTIEDTLYDFFITLSELSSVSEKKKVEITTSPVVELSDSTLSFESAKSFFIANGVLAQHKENFHYRPQQIEMLETIQQAFINKKHALIEAGTGTGKSFAYLIPSLLWSLEKEKRVVIATGTIALQEQLYRQDLPFLLNLLNKPLRTAIAKGRGNYLCLHRFYSLAERHSSLTPYERLLLASLRRWLADDTSGDKESLNLNKSELQFWQRIASNTETCLGKRCPHFDECFYFTNKKACETAHIIITNHSLLFQNLRLPGLLPEHKFVIIDEAHHLEDEATRQFTDTVDLDMVKKTLLEFSKKGGFFSRMLSRLSKLENLPDNMEDINLAHEKSLDECVEAAKLVQETIDMANDIAQLRDIGELRITQTIRNQKWWQDCEENLRRCHRFLSAALKQLFQLMQALQVNFEDNSDEVDISSTSYAGLESLLKEMTFSINRLKEQQEWLEDFISGLDESYVYWASTFKNDWASNFLLFAAKIDIMPVVKEKLFDNTQSTILTSATLAIGGSLEYTARNYLLDDAEYLSYITPSPFNYPHQSMIAIPNDHPDYSSIKDMAYTKNIIHDLIKLLPQIGGNTLILFTSYAMLNRVNMALKSEKSLSHFRILAHGQDGGRSSLIDALQNQENTILLGANSFWEGIDIKDGQLRNVIITKLPFVPPTMPLESARCELLKSQNRNPFNDHSLPQAILRFRQGCGRLIRSSEDKGAIIILDNRVIKKQYGNRFLKSLPEQQVVVDSIDNLTNILYQWHHD